MHTFVQPISGGACSTRVALALVLNQHQQICRAMLNRCYYHKRQSAAP